MLLLPLLGHRDLFDQYDFSQPWDSAKNLRLLDKMPAVFHDPIYGDKLGHFTNYAAVLGGGPGPKFAGYSRPILTAFSTSGVKMKDVTILPLERLAERVVTKDPKGEMRARTPRIVKIEQSDSLLIRVAGSTNVLSFHTIAVAAVSPERKIPWTKPEDITVGPEFPLQFGKPGGIAAPHPFGKSPTIHRAAPVLFAGGTSSLLLDTIDPSTLYAFLTRASGEVLDGSKVAEARVADYTGRQFAKLVIDCESGRATIIEPNLSPLRPDLEKSMPDDRPPRKP